jgi:hypothetical protein
VPPAVWDGRPCLTARVAHGDNSCTGLEDRAPQECDPKNAEPDWNRLDFGGCGTELIYEYMAVSR